MHKRTIPFLFPFDKVSFLLYGSFYGSLIYYEQTYIDSTIKTSMSMYYTRQEKVCTTVLKFEYIHNP